MIRFVVFSALIAFAKGQSTNVTQCVLFDAELPVNVHVEGCQIPPCFLPQGQDAVINVVFRAPRIIMTMRTLATAIVNFGIPINVPYDLGENSVTCNFLTNTYCPLLPGEIVQYTLKMFIERFFPVGTTAVVEFRVADENNDLLWCIRIPISITPPLELN